MKKVIVEQVELKDDVVRKSPCILYRGFFMYFFKMGDNKLSF